MCLRVGDYQRFSWVLSDVCLRVGTIRGVPGDYQTWPEGRGLSEVGWGGVGQNRAELFYVELMFKLSTRCKGRRGPRADRAEEEHLGKLSAGVFQEY